ncbi:MFS transporter, partial [Clostridium butyricum]
MNRKENSKGILLILTLGVFSIINTEMGVVGILPLLSQYFGVTISKAGLFVSMFALAVAVSGPIMPLIFSGINRKKVMIMVLSIFVVSSLVQALTTNFYVAIIARIIPALFHPVYVSLAFSVTGKTVSEKEAPKAAAKVMMGVSAGMVLGVPI